MGMMDVVPNSIVPKVAKTAENAYEKFLNSVGKRLVMENQGQGVLDDLIENGIAPADVSKKFWNETYFKLPPEAQAKAQKYLKSITGMEPGSTLDSSGRKANDWFDIASIDDMPSNAEYLEGIERGYVTLMDEANRRFGTATANKAPQYAPKAIKGLAGAGTLGAASFVSPQRASAESLQEPSFDPAMLLSGPARLGGGMMNMGIDALMRYFTK